MTWTGRKWRAIIYLLLFFSTVTNTHSTNTSLPLLSPRASSRSDVEFNDPAFPLQWHLTGELGKNSDLGVTTIWKEGVTGIGVTVAVLDSFIQIQSSDLFQRYSEEGSHIVDGRGEIEREEKNEEDLGKVRDELVKRVNGRGGRGSLATLGTGVAGLIAAQANNKVRRPISYKNSTSSYSNVPYLSFSLLIIFFSFCTFFPSHNLPLRCVEWAWPSLPHSLS